MSIKRITAASMSQGLKLVAQEFGQDAVILSNKKVAAGVEILVSVDDALARAASSPTPLEEPAAASKRATTALDDIIKASDQRQPVDTEQLSAWLGQLDIQGLPRKSRSQGSAQAQSGAAPQRQLVPAKASIQNKQALSPLEAPVNMSVLADQQQQMHALTQSVQQLQAMLAQSLAQPQPPEPRAKPQSSKQPHTVKAGTNGEASRKIELAQQSLLDYGFSAAFSLPQVEQGATAGQAVNQLLAKLPKLHGGFHQSEVIALVGPTGAGKTTTLSKIASQHVIEHGPSQLAILSLDQFRMGAQDSLLTLSRLLNIEFGSIDDSKPLAYWLKAFAGKKILIDTGGCKDAMQFSRQQFLRSPVPIVQLMCLPSSHLATVLKQHLKVQLSLLGRPDALVLTKVDENPAIGHLLELAGQEKIAPAYWANGSRIPDDLHKTGLNSLITTTWRQVHAMSTKRHQAA